MRATYQWCSSSQRACLLLGWSEFKSRFFCILKLERAGPFKKIMIEKLDRSHVRFINLSSTKRSARLQNWHFWACILFHCGIQLCQVNYFKTNFSSRQIRLSIWLIHRLVCVWSDHFQIEKAAQCQCDQKARLF